MKFMVHDKWANVMFLHWRVPASLEPALQDHCGGGHFPLDRTPDGSAWIGLVLLTECNVGPPPLFMSSQHRRRRCVVTHHGANVRTYVRVKCAEDRQRQRQQEEEEPQQLGGVPGIHFASLECDDRWTTWGANCFGMPYRIASMERRYEIMKTHLQEVEQEGGGERVEEVEDSIVCGAPMQGRIQKFRILSRRGGVVVNNKHNNIRQRREKKQTQRRGLQQQLLPSLLLPLLSPLRWLWELVHAGLSSSPLHCTKLIKLNNRGTSSSTRDNIANTNDNNSSSNQEETSSIATKSPPKPFTIECEWELQQGRQHKHDRTTKCSDEDEDGLDNAMARFFVERYFVYTRAYGIHWRGQVEHEPWPLLTNPSESIKLTKLVISNIGGDGNNKEDDDGDNEDHGYEPRVMRPLLRHMASTSPESVLFSPGVGPVQFEMLRPVTPLIK